MIEHAVTVQRTARYYTGGGGGDVDEMWLVCHGYGQLAARFIGHFAEVATPQRVVVAPEALSLFYLAIPGPGGRTDGRVGASWMTRERREDEIRDQISYLDTVMADVVAALGRRPSRFRALGFSQGAATLCRWLAAGRTVPDQLILWGGTIPRDISHQDAQRLTSKAPLVVVVGRDDDFVPPPILTQAEQRLVDARVPYRLVRFDGGHRLNEALLREIAEAPPRG